MPRHLPFEDVFVHGGLLLALSAGFGVAAVLAAHLGWGLEIGPVWPVLVQVHGHAQVFGWLGAFIMGVSLYFLPRFAGTPLTSARLVRATATLLVGGILSRSGGQYLLSAGLTEGAAALLAGCAAEVTAVALYVSLLARVLAGADPRRRPIRALRLCFVSLLAGWVAAAVVAAWQSWTAFHQAGLADPGWSRWGLDLFVGFVLLPVAFAFSVRTFPLYLRLPAVRWSVDALVAVCLLGVTVEAAAGAADLVGTGSDVAADVAAVGRELKGAAILVFIWRLDLLTRRRPAWIAGREGAPPQEPQLHPRPRPHLPDYGEFGHFEWHLHAAYWFLAIAAALELHGGLGVLTGAWPPFSADALRHAYLAGFGTLLLLGMAPRMLPGFWGLRRPASARLVDVSFGLALGAALLRFVPPLAPQAWQMDTTRAAFGLSGLLGWLAVASLAVNLWWTWWRRSGPLASGVPGTVHPAP